jgi:DNA-binding NtrC family response regulator
VDLAENELFGHAPGAYTDAKAAADGLIRQCEGGTLFLDEIDCLPHRAQVKFLRFLQEREYRPLGAPRNCRADVRVVAASNQDLRNSVQSGRLRPDLYYRLSVITLEMPPLRERKSDIPMLARHFVAKYAADYNLPIKELSRSALNKLLLYEWPGNVRELENVIQGAMVFSEHARLLPDDIQLPLPVLEEDGESFKALKVKAVAQFERAYLMQQLEKYGGNVTRAARAARKHRRAFWELMRKHRIKLAPPGATVKGHAQTIDLATFRTQNPARC